MITLIDSVTKLKEAEKKLSKYPMLGCDTETTGLDCHSDKIRLIQMAYSNEDCFVIDCFSFDVDWVIIQRILTSHKTIWHNAKFDIKFLMSNGVKLNPPDIFCTLTAAKIYTNGTKAECSLKACAERYLKISLDKVEQKSDFSRKRLTTRQIEYAANDAQILFNLRDVLWGKIKKHDATRTGSLFGLQNIFNIERLCIIPVAEMEYNGLNIDLIAYQEAIKKALNAEQEALPVLMKLLEEPAQYNLFGETYYQLNVGSPDQVQERFNELGIDCSSVNANFLKYYYADNPIVSAYLDWKLKSTLIKDLEKYPKHINPKTNRIHANLNPFGAESGRFSSNNPNIQNLPRSGDFRRLIVAADGYKFVCADFAQIELRIGAFISQDEMMIDALKKGEDLHLLTAALVNEMTLDEIKQEDPKLVKKLRQDAKAINFGLLYGMGAEGLQAYAKTTYGLEWELSKAKEYRDRYFQSYEGIRNWHNRIRRDLNSPHGVPAVYTHGGRRRILPTALQKQTILANSPDQGLGADICKYAIYLTYQAIEDKGWHGRAKLVNVVHDELLLEAEEEIAPQVLPMLISCMEEAGQAFIPDIPIIAEGSIGKNWKEAKG